MPKCRTCSNYWFKDWSINKECRLGHDTPDFGDTEACSEYEEQFTIGLKDGWSYEDEQVEEHEEIGDFKENKRSSVDSDSGGGISSSYSSGSSTGDGGAAAGIVVVGIILVVIFIYFNSNKSTKTYRASSTTITPNNIGQRTSSNNQINSEMTGVVNTPGDGFLALRSEPSAKQGSRLLKIPHATPLIIGECVSNSRAEHWCKTIHQGQIGWILDRYIIKEDKARNSTSTAEAITLPQGNADRKAILDVIRVEYSSPVIFEVLHLKNSGNWAWATVRPKTTDGKEGYEDQSVLLQKVGNEWQKVDGLDRGADCGEEHCPETNIAALQRRHPTAPVSIFE